MIQALRGAAIIGVVTLLEAIRSRLLSVSLFFAVVLVGLSITAASVSFGEQSRLIVDVGLAAASGMGSIIALALTIAIFASELDKRTAHALLARPVPRWAFVLGKYLGIVSAMEIVVVLMVLATAATVWLYGDPVPDALWGSLWLTCVEMALVVAVALLFSTMTVPVLAACYSVGVVLVGNLAGDILRMAEKLEAKGQLLGTFLRWAYYLPPDLEKLSLRTQAANHLAVPREFLFDGTAYGVAYAVAALVLTMWIFARKTTI